MSEYAIEIESGTAQDMYASLSSLYRKEESVVEDKTGADILDIRERLVARQSSKYPLWGILLYGRPISADVYREGEFWFAAVDDLNVSNEGQSVKEAVGGLKEHIQYFIEFYSEANEDELTAYANALRDRFAQIVIHE